MGTSMPPLFDTFYDNQKLKQTLIQLLEDGRLPHAILLEGEDGCGKTTFARMIAAANVCTGTQHPCGECRNCRLILSGIHPDVIMPEYEDRFRSFPVKEARELLATTYIRPNDCDKKTYILRNVHFYGEDTQNAMLKTIEEPPPNVYFILTCNNRSKLLSTILSRVTVFPVGLPTVAECQEALRKIIPDSDPELCNTAAILAKGNIGKAEKLLQDEALLTIATSARQAAQTICLGNEFDLLALFQPYADMRKREQMLKFLEDIQEYYLEILRLKNKQPSESLIPDAVLNRITTLQTMRILDIINATAVQVRQNVSPSLAAAGFCGQVRKIMEKT